MERGDNLTPNTLDMHDFPSMYRAHYEEDEYDDD